MRFIGSDGWVYVRRGFIDASKKSLLKESIRPNEINLYESNDHKMNFVESVKSRKETVAPVENGHRSGSACILGYIAMQLERKLEWDAAKEDFVNDTTAHRYLSRPNRGSWKL